MAIGTNYSQNQMNTPASNVNNTKGLQTNGATATDTNENTGPNINKATKYDTATTTNISQYLDKLTNHIEQGVRNRIITWKVGGAGPIKDKGPIEVGNTSGNNTNIAWKVGGAGPLPPTV